MSDGEKYRPGFVDRLEQEENERQEQAAGSLSYGTLKTIEALMPSGVERTAETGCGRSTIVFSNISADHTVFCLEDYDYGEGSSVRYFESSGLFRPETVTRVYGPTQQTLPTYQHAGQYDCVLIDGPHGYPFPDMEYFCFFPWVKVGGLLIIDDVQIASIGRMTDILQEDAMWDLEVLDGYTAIFRRTDAVTLSTTGDDWWLQGYNQRRTEPDKHFFINDDGIRPSFAEQLKGQKQRKQKKHVQTKKKKSIWKKIGRRLVSGKKR